MSPSPEKNAATTEPTFEAYKNKWSGRQSKYTVGALIIAGAWGLFTWYFQYVDRTAREMPVLEVRIAAWMEHWDEWNKDGKRLIRGTITVKNVGDQPTSIELDQHPTERGSSHGPIFDDQS